MRTIALFLIIFIIAALLVCFIINIKIGGDEKKDLIDGLMSMNQELDTLYTNISEMYTNYKNDNTSIKNYMINYVRLICAENKKIR